MHSVQSESLKVFASQINSIPPEIITKPHPTELPAFLITDDESMTTPILESFSVNYNSRSFLEKHRTFGTSLCTFVIIREIINSDGELYVAGWREEFFKGC
jgi:hypothetical protein